MTEACDGFVLAGTHIPGAYEDFVRLVVPELQRRGCSAGSMLRDTARECGAAASPTGDWACRRPKAVHDVGLMCGSSCAWRW